MSGFGELRSLLQARDDDARRQAWPRLTELFDEALGWDDPEVEHVWFPYAVEALERWPDRFRWAPKEWLQRMRDGEDLGPRMALVAALRLREYEGDLLELAHQRLDLDWIRHVDLYRCVGERETFVLRKRGLFPRMRSLVLTGAVLSPPQWPTALFTPQLTDLGLVSCDLTEHEALVIFSEGDYARLESLDLSDNPRLGAGLFELARTELPCLRALNLDASWTTTAQLEALTQAPWWPGLRRVRLRRSPMAVRDTVNLKGLRAWQAPLYVDALAHPDPWNIERFCHRYGVDSQRDRAHRRRVDKAIDKQNRADRIDALIEGSGLDAAVAQAAIEGS
jgi:hypothetical protein